MASISDYITNFLGDVNRALGGGPSVQENGNLVARDPRIVARDEAIHRVALCALACVAALFLLPSLLPTVAVASVVYYLAFHIPTHDRNYPRYVDYFFIVHPQNNSNYSNGGIYLRDPRDQVGGGRVGGNQVPQPVPQQQRGGVYQRDPRDQVGGGRVGGNQVPQPVPQQQRGGVYQRDPRDQVGGGTQERLPTYQEATNGRVSQQPNGGIHERDPRDQVGGGGGRFASVVRNMMGNNNR